MHTNCRHGVEFLIMCTRSFLCHHLVATAQDAKLHSTAGHPTFSKEFPTLTVRWYPASSHVSRSIKRRRIIFVARIIHTVLVIGVIISVVVVAAAAGGAMRATQTKFCRWDDASRGKVRPVACTCRYQMDTMLSNQTVLDAGESPLASPDILAHLGGLL